MCNHLDPGARLFDSERQLKKWSRKKKEALIEENCSKVSLLAKKDFD